MKDNKQGYIVHIGLGHRSKKSTPDVISSDGKFALTGGWDNSIRLWEIARRKEIRIFKGHIGEITSLAFSNNMKFALSGSSDNTVRYWDLSTGIQHMIFEEHKKVVKALAISLDDRFALSGSSDGSCILYDLEIGKSIIDYTVYEDLIESVAISPDNKMALTGTFFGVLTLWSLTTGKHVKEFRPHQFIRKVAFSKDGRYILSYKEGQVIIYEIETGSLFFDSNNAENFDPSSLLIQNGYFVFDYEANEAELKIKLAREFAETKEKTAHIYQHNANFKQFLALHYYNTFSHALNVQVFLKSSFRTDYSLINFYPNEFENIIALSSDGKFGILCDSTPDMGSGEQKPFWGIIKFDDVDNVEWFHENYDEECYGAINSDNCKALTTMKNILCLWDLHDKSLIMELKGHSSNIKSVGFSVDSCYAISGSEGKTICLWDLVSGSLIKILEGHEAAVVSVAISSDNSLAISASEDNTIRLWDLVKGEQVRVYKNYENINRISFSINNEFCFFSSTSLNSPWSNAISILETKSGKIKAIVPVFINPDDYLLFTLDGYFTGHTKTILEVVSFVQGLSTLQPYEASELMETFRRPDKFDFLQDLLKVRL